MRRGEGAGTRAGSALAGDAGSKRRRGDSRLDVRWSLIKNRAEKAPAEVLIARTECVGFWSSE